MKMTVGDRVGAIETEYMFNIFDGQLGIIVRYADCGIPEWNGPPGDRFIVRLESTHQEVVFHAFELVRICGKRKVQNR